MYSECPFAITLTQYEYPPNTIDDGVFIFDVSDDGVTYNLSLGIYSLDFERDDLIDTSFRLQAVSADSDQPVLDYSIAV